MLLLTFLFFGSEVQIQLNCNRRPRAVPYTIRVPWVLNSQTAVWVKASGIFSQNHKSTHLFKSLQVFSLCLSVYMSVCISSVQSLSRVRLFATPWTAARQTSLSITNSQSSSKLTSIELVMPCNHLILCRPLLLLPSIFPSIRIFSNESALCSRWPKY